MHGAQHASNEFVNSIALLDQRHQGSDPTLVVSNVSEVRKDQFLELLYLVLQHHQIRDGLVSLVWVVDRFEAEIFLVLESTIKLRVLVVERQLRKKVVYVFSDQRRISADSFSTHPTVQGVNP